MVGNRYESLGDRNSKEVDTLESVHPDINAIDRRSEWIRRFGVEPPPIARARRTGHLQDAPKKIRKR